MQTRIKISVLNNGNAIYYPQYRGWIKWNSFEESCGYYDDVRPIKFDSLDECKSFIDAELEKEAIKKANNPPKLSI